MNSFVLAGFERVLRLELRDHQFQEVVLPERPVRVGDAEPCVPAADSAAAAWQWVSWSWRHGPFVVSGEHVHKRARARSSAGAGGASRLRQCSRPLRSAQPQRGRRSLRRRFRGAGLPGLRTSRCRVAAVSPQRASDWCSSPRPAASAWAAAGVAAVTRARIPSALWLRWIGISPSSSGCNAIRACVAPWRAASSIVAWIASIISPSSARAVSCGELAAAAAGAAAGPSCADTAVGDEPLGATLEEPAPAPSVRGAATVVPARGRAVPAQSVDGARRGGPGALPLTPGC